MKSQIDRRRIFNQPQPFGGPRSEYLFAALVFLSGMAALGHQLLWTRRLIDLLGASGESSARVFGCFFLGLSLGSAAAAMLVSRIQSPLRFAGFVQLSIAVLVIPVIYLSELTDWIWPMIGSDMAQGSSGDIIKSLLTLGFVLPPAAMMGLSFPLIIAGVLQRSGGELGRSGIVLYASNTLGGAAGVLFVVMFALPRLGNFGSMVLATATDATVGIALLLYSKTCVASESSAVNVVTDTQHIKKLAKPFTGAIGLAFFSGMTVLALEVASFQMFQLVATISLYSPAAVLFSAIASLGIAAALFSHFESAFVSAAKRRSIVLILAAAGVFVALAPQVFMGIAQRSNWFADNASVSSFVFKLGALAMLSVGPAWLAAGLLFPFALASAGEHCSANQSGQRLGILLAVNGLGGLLGAELAYRVLLPAFGVYGSLSAIGFGLAVPALLLSMLPSWQAAHHAGRLAAMSSVTVVGLVSFFNSFLPVVNTPPGITAIDVQSGREGTVAVIEDAQSERSILQDNQYLLGGTSVRYDQERQVLLPLVLHRNPVQVGCIGLATGITPGAALTFPSIKKVTAVEISPLVVDAARNYFNKFNHDICRSESASVVVGDGRTFIASSPERFDVITGDLFLPWAPGATRLYSAEHFASVRRALKSGGLFCQWLPMYQLTPDQFATIADTFASEFGTTHLFINHFRVSAPMLGLVGWKQAEDLNWKTIHEQCDHLRESGVVLDPVLRHESGVRLLHLGPWETEKGQSRRVTLADPSLEYSAATVRLSANAGSEYYHPPNWVRFCRSRQPTSPSETGSDSSPQTDSMLLATGLLELDHARRTENKLADTIASRLTLEIPSCILEDRSADWNRWPGTSLVRPSAISVSLNRLINR